MHCRDLWKDHIKHLLRSKSNCLLAGLLLLWPTPWPRATWQGEGLFGLHVLTKVHLWRKSEKELKQEQSQEPRRKALLLSSSLWSAQLAFLYSQAYLPRDGTTLYRLDALHNKEMAHQHAHRPWWDNFCIEVSSSQVCQVWQPRLAITHRAWPYLVLMNMLCERQACKPRAL